MTSGRPTMSPIFVVFEGLDGSGKSTCARLLATSIGAEFMTTPSPAVRAFRDDLIADFRGCQEAGQLFYLATVFAASVQVSHLLAKGRSVVLDRYFLSTQAYAEFRGSALQVDDISKHLQPADLTVFLDVPLSVRRQRLMARSVSSADRETLAEAADSRLHETHAGRFHLPVVGRLLHVLGESMTPGDVVQQVLHAVAGGPALKAHAAAMSPLR